MRNKHIYILFFLVVLSQTLNAQYVNTCELVVVPGEESPLTLDEYQQAEEVAKELHSGYLADFLVPGNNGRVISRFGPRSGRMHYGVDLKMAKGDTIVAAQSGRVARAGWGTGWGNIIILQHENNIQTYYAHQTKFLVKLGDWVKKGQPIGLAGATGRARGPHLHFEMREDGRAFDPELVFDFENEQIREDAYDMESLMALHKKLKPKGYSTNVAVPEYYKVRSGDNLWAISRRFKTSIKEICRLNRISENSTLQIGQPLRLY